tara:strand:+ start:5900 stop:6853 length:954 start_codon:yes stop_codon:yes gene_type:complete
MPLSTWNLEWLNHNSQRKYPLADDASRYDSGADASFRIPDDFIVQIDLPIHSAMEMDPSGFFIRQIVATGTGYSIVVAFQQSAVSAVDVAAAHIPISSHTTEYKTYALGGIEPFDDTIGKITINSLAGISLQPAGLWNFTRAGAGLTPDAIRPIIQGVQSISVAQSAGISSNKLYGDIELIAGDNIELIVDGQEVWISAIDGAGTVATCECEGDAAALPCIKTINGIPPNNEGQMYLVGDDCLEFSSSENAIEVADKCCAPCCGCTELEAITKDLERFLQQQSNLEVFVKELKTSVTEMNITVLGSRLGDRGCITCE